MLTPLVVRGGSWNNNQRRSRCAVRNRNQPENFNNNVGFRVVLSIALLPQGRYIPLSSDAGRRHGKKPAQHDPGRDRVNLAGQI
jgi:hypothetical protein